MENRIDQRHSCEVSIVCHCYNQPEIFNAKMLNYSKSGMYFKSNTALKQGANIYFKIINCPVFPSDPESCRGLRTVSLAEVRWCKELNNGNSGSFEVGVKYY